MDGMDDLLKELEDLGPSVPSAQHKRHASAAPQVSSWPKELPSSKEAAPGSLTTPADSSSSRLAVKPIPSSSAHGSVVPRPSVAQSGLDRIATASLPVTSHQRKSSLDDLLAGFGDVPTSQHNPYLANVTPRTSSQLSSSGGALSKCTGLYLGGPTMARGRNGSSVGVLKCCDNLRCTKCDFKVMTINSKAWHGDCDYLFFRNNYPTQSKLEAKLSTAQDACAYCCQCSWRTVDGSEASKVDSYAGDLRWVCGGHAVC